ncbi:MAG: phosphatase PAP2 family protein [Candidatus Doudnabacteria bacterium]|nr:phosphatase PAP2 family protein [Candidatus Doudnabacteria bacterium]
MAITDQSYLNWQKELSSRKWYRRFWVFCGIYSVALIFLLGLYLLYLGETKVVILAFLAFVLGRGIISALIFFSHKKVRPYQKLNFNTFHSWFFSPKTKHYSSFPSDHAISMSAISTVFAVYHPYFIIPAIVICAINGWARIILGYHYILDIFAGWALGILSALAVVYWLSPMLFTSH